jgi:hypothetical protein
MGWTGDSINRSVDSNTTWQRYEFTATAPATGITYMYFWPTKGSTIDISEIQIEHKDHSTPFTAETRIDFINDYSTNNNVAELEITTTPEWVSSDDNGYYYFDGIDDQASLPSGLIEELNEDAFTLSLWVKSTGLTTGMAKGGLISLGYSLNFGINADGNLSIITDDGTNILGLSSNGINLFDNNFHFVQATYENSKLTLYIDGVENSTLTRGFSYRYTNSGVLGNDVNNSSICRFKGYMDEVKVYNRALSSDEIKYQYDMNSYKYE